VGRNYLCDLWCKLKRFARQQVGRINTKAPSDPLYPINGEIALALFKALDLLTGRGRLAPPPKIGP